MRYPNYPPAQYRKPTRNIVEGYVNFFGKYEADHRNDIDMFRPAHLRRIAMQIGRGCLVAADHNSKAAARIFARARRNLEPAVANPSLRIGREAAQLDTIANMLQNRNNSEQVTAARESLHEQAVRDIRTIRRNQAVLDDGVSPFRGPVAEMRGMLAQKVTLGLFTRYAHPYLMAVPALIHQDNGPQKRSNFDVLLVESMPGTEEISTYKLQIKCECLGLCTERKTQPWHRTQDDYDSDITLVSACCDLQRGDNRSRDLRDFRVADLLVKEFDGDITPDEVGELDGFTNSLILSVTMGDQRRMGTIGREYDVESYFETDFAYPA